MFYPENVYTNLLSLYLTLSLHLIILEAICTAVCFRRFLGPSSGAHNCIIRPYFNCYFL